MYFFLLIFWALVGLLSPQATYAHGSGFPPFFKVDGKIANSYFLQNVGVFSSSLKIPQDSAEKYYLPNDPIELEIDTVPLESVFAPEVMDKLKFVWDFGDGSRGTGVKNTHIYNKPGSYILSINADYGDPNAAPLLIESLLIQVLPDKNYSAPKPVIKINGKKGTKKDYNILEFDLKDRLDFDASESKANSKIVSYQWDFGDENTGRGIKQSHKYQLPQAFATVILRVTDEKGLFADQFVNVRNSGNNVPPKDTSKMKIIAGTVVIFLIGLVVVIFKKKK